jgi:hypothetical protein
MKNRKNRVSFFDRVCSKLFNWAAGMLLETLPVIGPIYKVATLLNDLHSVTRGTRRTLSRRGAARVPAFVPA